ncbi:hypothetical protein JXB12_05680 [candidate division KSB1 bacterium]|nr:hypothetical protein [candidate division KSB1 bacterium]
MSKRLAIISGMFMSFILIAAATLSGIDLQKEHRAISPGNTTYYINPAYGKDSNSGLKLEKAWRSFTPINKLTLAAG